MAPASRGMDDRWSFLLEGLPADLVQARILSGLDIRTVMRLAQTCRAARTVCYAPDLWRAFIRRDFGLRYDGASPAPDPQGWRGYYRTVLGWR